MEVVPDSQPGKVVAFYSFKGGTGRSMALANVACLLAARALRPVLVIDWDLEAPGLHRYFGRELFKAFKGSEEAQRSYPGLIDLFIELRSGLQGFSPEEPASAEGASELLRSVAINEFVVPTDRPNLHLLKAGAFDDAYAGKVSGFDWQDFYARAPSILRVLSERLAEDYDWVLIDSRTGLTDTSGICTMLMPETLVVVFTPNRQSVEGVVDLVRQAAKHRSASDDLRPLTVYPLPSRIEASEPALRKLWRHGGKRAEVAGFQEAFEQTFADIYQLERCNMTGYFDDIQIQHVPRYAYGEDIAVLGEETRDRLSLTRSFERFVDRLVAGTLPWEEQVTGAIEESAPEVDRSSVSSRAAMALKGEIEHRNQYLESRIQRWTTIDLTLRMVLLISVVSYTFLTFLSTQWTSDITSLASGSLAIMSLITLGSREILKLPQRLNVLSNLQLDLKVLLNEIDLAKDPGEVASWRNRVNQILARSPVDTGISQEAGESARVFISYRRSDGAGSAGRLYDDLVRSLGTGRVFMDMDSIQPGEDFVESLSRQTANANVVLAVIGRDWLGVTDSEGRRRVDDPYDFVRTELKLALERGQRVIPILVNGATMPRPDELPDPLRPLANLNAVEIGARTWQADVQRLADAISPSRRRLVA